MPLIDNSVIGLHNGVSTQALDLRPTEMVEEMINCYPSVNTGLRRRNPTKQLSDAILVEDEQFLYAYDRGLSGDSSEQYLITIDKINGLRVFDIVAKEYRTVTYSGVAQKYLESGNYPTGFSAMTIQDTTFICNRDIVPRMVGDTLSTNEYNKINFSLTGIQSTVESISTANRTQVLNANLNIIGIATNAITSLTSSLKSGLAPARFKTYKGVYLGAFNKQITVYSEVCAPATITFNVDGTDYKYTVAMTTDEFNIYPETLANMRTNIYAMLTAQLNPAEYVVSMDTNSSILIAKVDGTTCTVSGTVSFPTSVDIVPPALNTVTKIAIPVNSLKTANPSGYLFKTVTWSLHSEQNIGSDILLPVTTGTAASDSIVTSTYDKEAYVWIQQVSVDTAFPYTFYLTLRETNGTQIATTSSNATTTTGVASTWSTWADGVAGFTSTVSGSVLKITRDNGTAFLIEVSDTYGNQASSAWKGTVSQMSDLPKSLGFNDVIVKVDGVQRDDGVAYWVKYNGNSWEEHRDPNIKHTIDKTTMPHKLIRNADFTFTLSSIDWSDMLVGDADSQTIPNFIGSPIRDMFFIDGRLGLLTKSGINLSQVNNLSNFFRTTVLSLLDDSPICTFVDSNKAVGLEYASDLQGAIVLFGNKQQFILSSDRALTVATIKIQPICGYEIKKNIKPIAINDSIIFAVNKGNYTAIMEMNKTTISSNVKAEDISAHIAGYIPDDIKQLTCSPRNDAVFVTTNRNRNTIYFYKFYNQDGSKAQSAWSKWTFNVNLSSIFCFDRYLYLFGKRYSSLVPIEDATFAKTIDFTKQVVFESNITFAEFASTPTFELIDIDPYEIDATFKDNGTVRYDSELELSEWRLADRSKLKYLVGSLLLKTIAVSSSGGSQFQLLITDRERGTTRIIPANYVVGRRPFISGRTENTRIRIVSTNGDGFQLNSINVESQYNTRSKRM